MSRFRPLLERLEDRRLLAGHSYAALVEVGSEEERTLDTLFGGSDSEFDSYRQFLDPATASAEEIQGFVRAIVPGELVVALRSDHLESDLAGYWKQPSLASGALARMSSRAKEGRGSSGRITLRAGKTVAVGGMASVS